MEEMAIDWNQKSSIKEYQQEVICTANLVEQFGKEGTYYMFREKYDKMVRRMSRL